MISLSREQLVVPYNDCIHAGQGAADSALYIQCRRSERACSETLTVYSTALRAIRK